MQRLVESIRLFEHGFEKSIIDGFRKQWRIESGFRESRSFKQMNYAQSNSIKTFEVGLGNYGYNKWRIQPSLYKRLQNVPKSWHQVEMIELFAMGATTVHVKSRAVHGMSNA
ncbi:MAG: hypothetical protein Q6373_003845 [Candidatus Sigynarchaeota archaeon]